MGGTDQALLRLSARRAVAPAVPVPPHHPVEGDDLGDIPQAGHKWQGQEQDGRRTGQVNGDQVDVGGIVEAGYLVPESVEPQPRLARVAARLVHDAPLATGQVLGAGLLGEVLAVFQEQQRFGEVRAVEGLVGDQVGVERPAAGKAQLGCDYKRDRPVIGRWDDRRAIMERDVVEGLQVPVLPGRAGAGVAPLSSGQGHGPGQGSVGASWLKGSRTKSVAVSIGILTPARCSHEIPIRWTLAEPLL